jgi:hypothetical protein
MDMAAMALPIRELSASVQYEAAYAQKTFWKVVDAKARERTFDLVLWVYTKQLWHSLGKTAELQRTLIGLLQGKDFSRFDADAFDKIACDLERIVSLTNALLDNTHTMPEKCVAIWSPRLEEIADLTAHIDNFAESFRIASDEACTALLANMASQITADAARQALLGIR